MEGMVEGRLEGNADGTVDGSVDGGTDGSAAEEQVELSSNPSTYWNDSSAAYKICAVLVGLATSNVHMPPEYTQSSLINPPSFSATYTCPVAASNVTASMVESPGLRAV